MLSESIRMTPLPSENPVFVVGVFRSGTSLLSSILNQNPQVALMYECDVWNFPQPLLSVRFRLNWTQRMEFYNQSLSRHRLLNAADPEGVAAIPNPLALYQTFARQKGARVCGEKSPSYCDRLEQLHRQYPQARFIYVWRNPLEVYRSVLKAGQTSRFFGKPGMLSRMIYLQEEAIRQAAVIEAGGARIFRLDYASLVDQTERVCRELSAFLEVPFDPKMLELNQADLSAIFTAPHHAFLRRGIIERQTYTEKLVSPRIARKLEGYRGRWERQQAAWLARPGPPPDHLPGALDRAWQQALGKTLTRYDALVRAAFEFLPLRWLQIYRLLKNWLMNPPAGGLDTKPASLLKEWRLHWPTILTAALLLFVVSIIHRHANPHLLFILFYAIPCTLLALVVNTRWASLFVVLAAIIAPIIQYDGDSDYRPAGIFAWNLLTRLILLEMAVLVIARIRRDFSEVGTKTS